MGRFESPIQVVGLFLAASVISVGVIFFLNAEAHSRLSASHHNHEQSLEEQQPSSSRSSSYFSFLTRESEGERKKPFRHHGIIHKNNDNIKDKNEVDGTDFFIPDSTRSVEINDASLSAFSSLLLSPSSSSSPSELTKNVLQTKAQNKASKILTTYSSVSAPEMSEYEAVENNNNNVTLLNFLEDGLEKLLSLIKQAKNTYKSYYKRRNKMDAIGEKEPGQTGPVVTAQNKEGSSVAMDVGDATASELASVSDKIIMEHVSSESLGGNNNNYRRKYRRRRKKREVGEEKEEKAMMSVTMITNGNGGGSHARFKRAVISSLTTTSNGNNGRRGRRIGENEPYYWQMLEDNNNDHHHHHHHQRNNNNNNNHQHSQYPYDSQTHNQNHHQQQHQLSVSNGNHYPGLYPGQGAPQAVASAFTGGKVVSSGGESNNHGVSISSPTSDFHKIRHAMNKLGGGGLDISVVERMILDTKSGRGGGGGQQQQQKHKSTKNGPPISWGIKAYNPHNDHDDNASNTNAALLTTATTKTTQAGRQDEGLYVNQLRHQQQQLAQSLLPPTVTWLSNNENSAAAHYLPLPASSLATDEEEGDSADDSEQEEGRNNNVSISDDDTSNEMDNEEDSSENSLASSASSSKKKGKMKSKKLNKSRKNNELSYSQKSSSTTIDTEKEEGDEVADKIRSGEDYSFPYMNRKETESYSDEDVDQHSNNNSDNNSRYSNESEEEDDEDIDEENENDEVLLGESEESHHHHHKKKKIKKDSATAGNQSSSHYPSTTDGQQQDCYHTDDVLIVVAITCCLNFAFVLVIWALVRWFSISSNPKEKDFQNLGDCDDTMDPTIVFHGVTEDPCWTMGGSGKESRGGGAISHGGGGGVGMGEMLNTRNCHEGGGPGTIRSIHSSSSNKYDLFPTIGGKMGNGGINGASLGGVTSSGLGATVMTMTMDRSSRAGGGGGYHGTYHGTGGGSGILGMGAESAEGGYVMNGIYSFRPEHVPSHHSTVGGSGMVRSYSQSMEDLRYLQ